MALDYTLRMQTELSPEKIAKIALGNASEEIEVNEVYPRDFGCVSIGYCSMFSKEIVKENLRINPDVFILFSLDPSFDRETSVTSILKSVVAVLQDTFSDLVLLFNGDYVLLTRRNGELTLNSNSDFWSRGSRLKQMKIKYRFEDMPVLS